MSDDRRIRVLAFTTLYPNSRNPIHGLFVRNRLRRVADGCELVVVAPVNVMENPIRNLGVPRRETLDGLTVYHPRFSVVPGLFKHMDAEFLYRQTLPTIRRELNLEDFDVIDGHYAYPDGVAAMRLSKTAGKPIVLNLRGSDINVLTRFKRRRQQIARAVSEADAVVAVSRALAAEVEMLGASPAKIHVIPNGVDTRKFFPRGREEARRQLGLSSDEPVVLSVGRLAPVKGFDLLIRAIASLRDGGSDVRCVILGGGRMRRELETLVRELDLVDRIRLDGPVSPDDLPMWYSAADLFCLASTSEGCPNVVLESLACGTPVVGTAVGGIPEMVEEGVTGFLVRERRPAALADRIRTALERSWDPERIAKSEWVRDWSEVGRAQLEVLRGVVGQA